MITNQRGGGPDLADSFNRDENFERTWDKRSLSRASSHPNLQRQSHNAFGYSIEEDEKDKERLKLMYPEPGLRETFVRGVIPPISIKPVKNHDGLSTKRYNMENPFLQGTLSTRQNLPANSERIAMEYAGG